MSKYIKMVILVLFSLLVLPQRINADDPVIVKPTFEQSIQQIFGSQTKVAMAVFKAESNLNPKSINYNCFYNGRSTFCKKQDVYKASSVDCGIAQINIKGKVCPDNLLTLDGNLEAIENIYKTQGLRAWVAYNNKLYLKFM